MWWDDDLIKKSFQLYMSHPRCVNIHLQFLSQDRELTDDLTSSDGGVTKLKNYGLTDTGLYHLSRWQTYRMQFGANEQGHAQRYLDEGYEVLCHPWPTDAPIPWPPVIRNGVQRGREIVNGKPFLLKPLSPDDVARIKTAENRACLEDLCIPWGWVCVLPMWVSGLDSIDYWVLRYRDAKKNGLSHLIPRLDFRGVDGSARGAVLKARRYSPSPSGLFIGAPARELIRRLRRT
jgi:hypothetical protein